MRGRTGTLGAISSLAALAAAAALAAGPAGAASAASGTSAAQNDGGENGGGGPGGGRAPAPGLGGHAAGRDGERSEGEPRDDSAGPRSRREQHGFSGAALYGVSCTGRKQCTATGLASTRTGKNYKPLAERWNGATWAKQTTPIPNSGSLLGGTLTAGVSCTSSSACVATGYAYSAKTIRLLGEGLERPHLEPPARFDAGHARLRVRNLLQMGQGLPRRGRPELRHDPGRALERPEWSAQTTKHTGNSTAWPAPPPGIARPSAGTPRRRPSPRTGTARPGRTSPRRTRSRSPSWRACPARPPLPASQSARAHGPAPRLSWPPWPSSGPAALDRPHRPGPGSLRRSVELNSVSCISATNCMAVGDDENAAGTADVTLAAQWNGTTWTSVATPSPATFSALFSVSCTSATFCSAVGASSPTATGVVSPVAETWNGSTWSLQTAVG